MPDIAPSTVKFQYNKLAATYYGAQPLDGYKQGLFFQQGGNPSQNPQMSQSGINPALVSGQENKLFYDTFGGDSALPQSFVANQPQTNTANPFTPVFATVITDMTGAPILDQYGQPLTDSVG